MGLSPTMYQNAGDFSPISTDVIIIGGGATGAGVARDCALRGINCVLLERRDIATGATGRNHGLWCALCSKRSRIGRRMY